MGDSIVSVGRTLPADLANALASAGDRSAVDFSYLVKTAIRESSLDADAKAATSSATGLFQFIESTWLQMMRDEGAHLGYGDFARQIGPDGTVADPGVRAQILDLRRDPQVSADLAAAYTRHNGEVLSARFGRQPSPGELYIAHVLGAEGAAKLFDAGLENPDQAAASVLPEAARSNPAIFLSGARARTVREVYMLLARSFEGAKVPAESAADPVPSRYSSADMSFTALFTTGAAVGPRSLLSAPPGGAALFSQLYGQGQAGPVVKTP